MKRTEPYPLRMRVIVKLPGGDVAGELRGRTFFNPPFLYDVLTKDEFLTKVPHHLIESIDFAEVEPVPVPKLIIVK